MFLGDSHPFQDQAHTSGGANSQSQGSYLAVSFTSSNDNQGTLSLHHLLICDRLFFLSLSCAVHDARGIFILYFFPSGYLLAPTY